MDKFIIEVGYEPYHHVINGTISEAIKAYEANGVPLRQLLSDYNDVLTYPSELKKALNPWLYLTKGIKNLPVVSGVSVAETLFNVSAMSLYRQKPINVIKSLFYRNKSRNDSGMELYFLNTIKESLSTENVMIINPSPIIVEFFQCNNTNNHYVVLDDTLAKLYAKQYKDADFVTIDNMEQSYDVRDLVVIASNAEEKDLIHIFESILRSSAENIYGIVQNRLIDNKQSVFWEVVQKGELSIQEIAMAPNEISISAPRKKSFIYMNKTNNERLLSFRKLEYNSSDKKIYPGKVMEVDHNELLSSSTINRLWRCRSQEPRINNKTIEYNSATLYFFSKEIVISYTIYHDDKSFYGKAYYAATKNTVLPEIRGKALTSRTEKGLRAKNTDGVITALESFPYNKKISDAIVTDIIKCYLEMGKRVSLKTLWFCMRGDLQKNRSYDDVQARELFSGKRTISDLFPDEAKGEEIRAAICEQLEEGEEIRELQLLKLVNMIIEIAVNRGYLGINRVSSQLPAARTRASKRQSEVRQALAKRSFEDVEERKMMEFLLPRCEESSLKLAVLIRLLTGISIKEVGGLSWNDFGYNDVTGVYKLYITKFVNNDGKVVSHALEENWEKYRVLPISEFLGELLMERKKHLQNKGVSEEVLNDYPIVMERENISSLLKGHKEEYCRPASIAKKCREAITKAEISSHMIILPENDNEIEIDINSYNGDIFRTNFRDKAINLAGFGLDELHYYLGLKKPDTFSQHYCDYSNEYVQLMMARKLDRWTSVFLTDIENKRTDENTYIGQNGGVPCVEIEIINRGRKKNAKATIEIETAYGFKTIITSRNLR